MLLRPFTHLDIYRLNRINLDDFTENFPAEYYLRYLTEWPEFCVLAEACDGSIVGYIIGNFEKDGTSWFGHVSALSVAPEYRGKGLASALMKYLETQSFAQHAEYVDLFVRVTNTPAVKFYLSRGYRVHQTIPGYYTDGDAYSMRLFARVFDKLETAHDSASQ